MPDKNEKAFPEYVVATLSPWTVLMVFVLLAGAVFLTASILFAYIGLSFFWTLPGRFLLNSYGLFSLYFPAVLIWASVLAIKQEYSGGHMFLLATSIIPFLTTALAHSLLIGDDIVFAEGQALAFLGRTGFILLATLLVGLQIFISFMLSTLIFNPQKTSRPGPKKTRIKTEKQNSNKDLPEQSSADMFEPETLAEQEATDEVLAEIESLEELAEENTPDLPLFSSLDTMLEPDKPVAEAEEVSADVFLEEIDGIPIEEIALPAPSLPEFDEDDEEVDVLLPVEEDVALIAEELFEEEMPIDVSPLLHAKTFQDEEIDEEIDEEDIFDDIDIEIDVEGEELARVLSEAEETAREKSKALTEAKERAEQEQKLKKKTNWALPVEGLLTEYPDGAYWEIDQTTKDAALALKETLEEFKIQAEVTGIRKGPVITMFEILPAPGVKLSKIVNLQDNIALRLAASSVRIVAPIPGKQAVGIEVPNQKRNIVSFREIITQELSREGKKMEVPVILGKDITGEAQTLDLVQTPHLLIAGSTGSGKSVCVNSIILSILYQCPPSHCRLVLIDPKIVELKLYNDIPHLLTPVITEPKRAFQALQYCIYEMERRYSLLDSMGVRNIRSYNKRIKERKIATEHLPYIVVIIDEFADLMATTGRELEDTLARLAAMSRAVGIHLVLATQRPSIDVITGIIKANIPSRIAFMVASKTDSRIIIDRIGAEKLLGKGDMLFSGAVDPFPIRMQGAFVSEEEVELVVDYVKTLGAPDYIDEDIFFDDEEEGGEAGLFGDDEDPLYERALEIVMQQGKASASYLQRRLKIGYNRAARLVEIMEDRGIVGPSQGSKPRELIRAL